ncbi:putative Intraflagellar transport protein 74 [Blattamonas nauphoetae]|uniref:Intraflagellar transport protein 74 n=1 Tax=Blattamonas nauphoetae TaxID=2049346 RepID=A0ABQ9XWZ8_9EUKA|nr:putative Intraflagellar transport protein 74 [Blattamonas nauphoetae]
MNRPGTANRLNSTGLARPPSSGGRQKARNDMKSTGMIGIGPERIASGTGIGGPRKGAIDNLPEANAYAVRIRNKISEINEEINRLQQDMDERQDDPMKQQKLRKQIQEQSVYNKSLKDQLADLTTVNELAQERVYLGGFNDQDVRQFVKQRKDEISALNSKNERLSDSIDEVFSKREQLETENHDLEQELSDRQMQLEEKLSDLSPKQQDDYHDLVEEREHLEEEKASLQSQQESNTIRIRRAQAELGSDVVKKRLLNLRQELERFERQRDELGAERGEGSKMPKEISRLNAQLNIHPDDTKETIQKKVKDNNAKIKEFQRQVKTYEQSIAQLRQQLMLVGAEETEHESREEKMKKMDDLRNNERELDANLASFDQEMENEHEIKISTQQMVVALLMHISQGLKNSTAVITPEQVQQLQQDLDFKKKLVDDTKDTKQELDRELAQAKDDLEKIKSLELSINDQLDALGRETREAEEQSRVYADIDGVKAKYKQLAVDFQREEKGTSKRIQSTRLEVQNEKADFAELENEVKKDKACIQLDTVEKKISNLFQIVNELQQVLIVSERESSFQRVRADCMTLVNQMNALHVKAATEDPTSITTSAAIASTQQEPLI